MAQPRLLLRHPRALLVVSLIASAAALAAQAPAPGGAQAAAVRSPEVRADRRVTFRVSAPAAQKVELRSPGDIPGVGGRGVAPPELTRNADGVWEGTFGPLPAGAYRYVFAVDGVSTHVEPPIMKRSTL